MWDAQGRSYTVANNWLESSKDGINNTTIGKLYLCNISVLSYESTQSENYDSSWNIVILQRSNSQYQ